MTRLAIIVLNWKQPKLTINSIDSILKISHLFFTFQIILVDNGSPDDSLFQFGKKYSDNKQVVIIKNESNLGYVEGNNTGIRYALKYNFDYVLIINNDVLVKPDFLDILIKQANSKPGLDILGPKIYFAPGYEYHHDRYSARERGKIIWSVGGRMDWPNIIGSNIGIDEYDRGQYDRIRPSAIDFISGCCILIKVKVFQKIGMFDSRFFLFLEDSDFCQRAKRAGFHLSIAPKSVIWHLSSQTTGAGSFLHDYFITRNRMLFGFRYAGFRTKLALIRQSVTILFFDLSFWKRKGVIDFFLGKFGRGSWQ